MKDALVDYLNLLLEIYRDKGKVLYKNIFKGKLNQLNNIEDDLVKVVRKSVSNGWVNFYALNDSSNFPKKGAEVFDNIHQYIDEGINRLNETKTFTEETY